MITYFLAFVKQHELLTLLPALTMILAGARKETAIHNILLCLQIKEYTIEIQYLDEGIFYLLGRYTTSEADDVLAYYERFGMLSMCEGDVYSGLYLLEGRVNKVTSKNLPIKIRELAETQK